VAKHQGPKTLWWRLLPVLTVFFTVTITALISATWVPLHSVDAMINREHSQSGRAASGGGAAALTASEVDLPALVKEVQSQTATFSAEKDELDYLTRIIELMMTAMGIYTIILAVVSWKALDSQKQEFERASQSSLENLERLRNELQLDFPMLGRIQKNFKNILATLGTACKELDVEDVLDDSFSNLSKRDVQRILFYENAITTALLLDTKGYEDELSEIYRLLGMFYGSRFYSTTTDNEFSSSESPDYFYRAQFYFDRAIDLAPGNYNIFMYAGYFSQYYDDRQIANLSRHYFEQASQIESRFQKPLVSVALLELEGFEDPDSALRSLKGARTRDYYDRNREYPRFEYIVSFRQGCMIPEWLGW